METICKSFITRNLKNLFIFYIIMILSKLSLNFYDLLLDFSQKTLYQ